MSLNVSDRISNWFSPGLKSADQIEDEKRQATKSLSDIVCTQMTPEQNSKAERLDAYLSKMKSDRNEAYEAIGDGALTFGKGSETLFHLVAEKGTPDEMRVLRDHFPEMASITDNKGGTLLMAAAKADNSDVITYLLQDVNADPADKDLNGWTALIWAALSNAVNAIKSLLNYSSVQRKLNIDETNHDNETAFNVAMKSGSLNAAALLKAHGAAINIADQNGVTPLMRAVRLREGDQGAEAITLLNPSPDELARCDKSKRNALGHAIADGTVSNMKALLSQGANPNWAGSGEMTAFGAAIDCSAPDKRAKLDLIIEHSSFDPNIKGAWGNTAVLDATEVQAWDIVERLIAEKGADPTIQNDKQQDLRSRLDARGTSYDIRENIFRQIDKFETDQQARL